MQNFDITVQYPNWVWTFSVLISSLFRIRCYIFRRRGEIMMEWNCPPPPSGSMIYSHYSLLLCCINIHKCLYIYTVVTNSEARKGVVGNPLNGSYYSSGYHGSCLNKLDFISADRGGGGGEKKVILAGIAGPPDHLPAHTFAARACPWEMTSALNSLIMYNLVLPDFVQPNAS